MAITASELKRKGVSIIERLLRMEDEVVISVSGKPRYVVIDLTRYDDLCEREIAAAWTQMREDVAAGRYTCQGADTHVARVKDELTNRRLVFTERSKKRVVFLGSAAKQRVWRYLATRPGARQDDPLFATCEGTAMQRTGLRLLIFRIGRHAGVPDAGVHRFRHTFAVNFLRNGGNLLALQDLLGHERLDTVRIYAKQAEVDPSTSSGQAPSTSSGQALERQQKGASPADRWKL